MPKLAIFVPTLFIFLSTTNFVTAYYCKNKKVEIVGVASSSETDFYSLLGNGFNLFRRGFAVNSKIEAEVFSNNLQNDSYGFDSSNYTTFTKPMVFSTMHSNYMTDSNKVIIPLVAQPLVIIYNLPNVTDLNLTLGHVANIYAGIITRWNDARLRKVNPNANLPDAKILPIARQDSDATTALFTQILSNYDETWNSSYGIFDDPAFVHEYCCSSTKWPENVVYMYGQGVEGMIGLVKSIDNTIGYETLHEVNVYNYPIAKIMTDAGVALLPTTESVYEMMDYSLKLTKSLTSLDIKLEAPRNLPAYPMSSFSYMVLSLSYSIRGFDCCVIQELVGFVDWFLTTANDSSLHEEGYIPVTAAIKDRIMKHALSQIRCSDVYVYQLYLNSLNQKLDRETWPTALSVGAGFVALALGVFAINYCYTQKFHVDITRWVYNSQRVQILEAKDQDADLANADILSNNRSETKSIISRAQTASRARRIGRRTQKEYMIPATLDENKVYLDTLVSKIPQQWSMGTKRALAKLKNVIDKNVAILMGVTVINFAPFAICEYCSKGTLHYILRTSRYNLTDSIKFQFVMGVAQGLKYLHQYGIVHGYLSSITCYLDANWTIKICNWGKLSLYEHENQRDIAEYCAYEKDSNFDENRLIELLYVDPMLTTKMDESVDVYSMGVLLVEVFSRKLPYEVEVNMARETYSSLLTRKFTQQQLPEPISKMSELPKEISILSTSCTSTTEPRPKMDQVCITLKKSVKSAGSIVDIIMDALEAHNDALEEKVNERTAELGLMSEKMRDLLNEVLPPQIAEKLLAGIPVLPETFDCISIYFSDIVGFTTISARSSPNEVMAFLNDLWLSFDTVIEKFQVYKVDTIGDAYFVCSGLPDRNGVDHIRQIAMLSLALMDNVEHFVIRHLPDVPLKIRIGVNSGPVTAGVVGSKMPQYCVFGDTVNMAMTMEGTSVAGKIQLSESAYQLLSSNFPNVFELEFRGEQTIENKGTFKTYWLIKQNKF